jgi:hypothetical protein
MPFQYSEKMRNERLNVVASALGPAAIMRIYSGDVPSSCDAANPPGELVEIELPRRPFLAANGAKLMINRGQGSLMRTALPSRSGFWIILERHTFRARSADAAEAATSNSTPQKSMPVRRWPSAP